MFEPTLTDTPTSAIGDDTPTSTIGDATPTSAIGDEVGGFGVEGGGRSGKSG